MKTEFLNRNIAFILIFLILSNNLFLFGQAKRGATSPKTASKTTPKTAPMEALVSPTSQAMAAAWNSGKLPQPLPKPDGNSDEVAAILASKVAARNEESVPALLAALQLAGFFVTNQDGSHFLTPADGRGQGLPINGWEIASAAKMYGEGKTTNLAELAEKLKSIPAFKQADAGSFLLDGVRRNAANDENPYLRVWARFISELGKNSSAKSDILGDGKPEQIEIDAIQHLLLMRRLYGDLYALSEKYKPQAVSAQAVFQRSSQPQFLKANFVNSSLAPVEINSAILADNPPDKQPPCKMDGNVPTIMDAAATAAGVGFDQFLGYLEDNLKKVGSDRVKAYGTLLTSVNIVLAYGKFIATYAAIESKIVLEDAPPLVRTKNALPGDRKRLKTEVRMNTGNWQMLNCFRMALNVSTGMDFSLVSDGPLGDVGIRWKLDEGGGRDVYSNSTGVTGKEQIVGFAADGTTRIQDKGTGAGTGKNSVNDLTFTKTDEKGEARIILEGSPQKNAKIGKVTPVMKQAKIRTNIRMKAGEIKGDMVDVAGQAIAAIPGLISMPVELLYRMDWASVAELTVPVRDWEMCKGGWSGTIEFSFRRTENKTIVTKQGENPYAPKRSGTKRQNFSYNYSTAFNVKNSESYVTENGTVSVTLEGEMNTEAHRITDDKESWSEPGDCAIAGMHSTFSLVERGKHNDSDASARLRIEDGRFFLGLGGPEVPYTSTRRSTLKHFGWCGENQDGDETTEHSGSFSWEAIEVEGLIDPKNPNQIEGSKSYTDEMGREVTIRWSLKNCN